MQREEARAGGFEMNEKTMKSGYAQILTRYVAVFSCVVILLPGNPMVFARYGPYGPTGCDDSSGAA
jgi:hypothetical protein